jgi:glycosyltransferase involved in cell wall biosynthesis
MKFKNLSVSFIFPIYNEEKRLKFLFKNIIQYEKNNGNKFIFVNNGSNDKSLEYILDFVKKIIYKKNLL